MAQTWIDDQPKEAVEKFEICALIGQLALPHGFDRSADAAHGSASHCESLASGNALRDQLRYQFESRHEPPFH